MKRQGCFAQHWCLEAVNTVLEGRALGEGDGWELCGKWAATLLLLCVVPVCRGRQIRALLGQNQPLS